MKKILFTIFSLFLLADFAIAGGIVTNTNQSAAWVRTLARDASVDVDAVFFNPAGLTQLEDGFYLQVNSQTISQGRTVVSSYPTLKDLDPTLKTRKYEGKTFVPVLPTAYAVFKKGKFAFSGGFTVIGGGGSAEFENGLPEFEYQVSGLPSTLTGIGQKTGQPLVVTGYEMTQSFNGTSAYYGFQAGVSYKLNDFISLSVGGRYVSAKNSYQGNIGNIKFNTPAGLVKGTDLMTTAKPVILGLSGQLTQVTQIPGLLNPYLGSFGGVTLDQAKGAGAIDEATYNNLVKAGQLIGLTDPSKFTLKQLNDGIVTATPTFNAQIAQLNALAAADLSDKELDVEQKGSGITPIFGIDLSLFDGNFGLAVKYEMKTSMNVKTNVIKDNSGTGLFKHDEEVPNDIPAMLSVGLRQKFGALNLNAGFHYYFDNDAKYGKKNAAGEFVTNGQETTFKNSADTKLLAGNSYEFAIGAQYDITKMFGISAGFLMTEPNPNSIYQSALSQTFSTRTFGFGAIVHATPKLDIDLGFSMTSYEEYKKDFSATASSPKYSETYDKTAMVFALGVGYRL